MDRTIVMTYFEPFGRRPVNATQQAATALTHILLTDPSHTNGSTPQSAPPQHPNRDTQGDTTGVWRQPTTTIDLVSQEAKCCLLAVELPVSFRRARSQLQQIIDHFHPAAMLCLGEDGTRKALQIERHAYNECHATMADNDGIRKTNAAITTTAAVGSPLKANWDPERLVACLHSKQLAAEISDDPGRYVCNTTAYTLAQSNIPGGFCHIPALPVADLQQPITAQTAQQVRALFHPPAHPLTTAPSSPNTELPAASAANTAVHNPTTIDDLVLGIATLLADLVHPNPAH
ncbi:Pyrrolidone-carboxylate peptidase [Corynebacterium choanae]|uniref:Pyrrolidone-carboxylate peptidase n=2 Tax=Corynebacterium choanae TaxID=1862358 RepID=A0A3G6J3S1_9CORY|nr:Pyrrolidone-carboxylate peptidase [Corynebacterium choanae]